MSGIHVTCMQLTIDVASVAEAQGVIIVCEPAEQHCHQMHAVLPRLKDRLPDLLMVCHAVTHM